MPEKNPTICELCQKNFRQDGARQHLCEIWCEDADGSEKLEQTSTNDH